MQKQVRNSGNFDNSLIFIVFYETHDNIMSQN